MEATNRGIRPSVLVELMNAPLPSQERLRGAMLIIGMQLQAELLRELDRAVETHNGVAATGAV